MGWCGVLKGMVIVSDKDEWGMPLLKESQLIEEGDENFALKVSRLPAMEHT